MKSTVNTPIVRKFHSDRDLLNIENSTDTALNFVKRLIEDHKQFKNQDGGL